MTAPLRVSDRVALVALATLGLAGVVSLATHWGLKAEYADRFLILLGAGLALKWSWPTAPSLPRPLTGLLGLTLVVAAALAFPVAWLVQIQIGPRTLLLWWQCAAMTTAAAGLILAREGWRKLRVCAFSLLFLFLALPIPSRILAPLQEALQQATTRCAGLLLSQLYSVNRSRFVLELPGGPLEVAEACSGIRSLTALVAIAAFVAFLRGFGPRPGSVLVLLSIPVVAATNILRVTLSGIIQETAGAKFIQGEWHEALGFVMVFVGLAGILGLASVMNRWATPWESTPVPLAPASIPTRSSLLGWLMAGWLVASALGTVYAMRLGWLAIGETLTHVPLDQIPLQIGNWKAPREEAIPKEVTDKLGQDLAMYRVYTNNLGQEVHCWVMYWSSLSAIRGYHHPDVCWGNRGGIPTYRGIVPVIPSCGGELPLTARRYNLSGGGQHFILYWTQDGQTVWDEQAEAEASGFGGKRSASGIAWVADLLVPPAQRAPGRLTVVLATRHVGATAEREAVVLARRLAEELYTLCPWASPPQMNSVPPSR